MFALNNNAIGDDPMRASTIALVDWASEVIVLARSDGPVLPSQLLTVTVPVSYLHYL